MALIRVTFTCDYEQAYLWGIVFSSSGVNEVLRCEAKIRSSMRNHRKLAIKGYLATEE